jgi:hypothetical protein
MELATGDIIAYTDDDCFADEDWLYFLVAKLLDSDASGVGGPNLLPTHDGPVAACVSASPGTPAHILVDDSVAEHVPGCNMAFWADRLRAIGGFDPAYRAAGDDVDVCWRLQEEGEKIVYAPAAMVWHHRRSTVKAYLKQQRGYGIAEALLKRKHPEKFRGYRNDLSWNGRIYTRAGLGLAVGKPIVHHGVFGAGLFQTLYSPPQVWWPLMVHSLEWWALLLLLLGIAIVAELSRLTAAFLLVPVAMLAATLGVAYLVAGQATPPVHQRRWWSRLLIAAMHIAQPVERGWARYRTRFRTIEIPESLHLLRRAWERRARRVLGRRRIELWSEDGVGRETLLERLVALAGQHRWFMRIDPGWAPHDVRFYGDRWCKADLTSVTESHGGGRRLTRLEVRLMATLYHKLVLLLLAYGLVLVSLADHRLGVLLVPPALAVAWQLTASRRRLLRTLVACILTTAQELRMTLVGAPELLRAEAEPEAAPIAAAASPGEAAR